MSAPADAHARLPDFFIIGSMKCGTTALYQTLRRHPQIYMPSIKEPRFLASDLRARVPRAGESDYPLTLDDYLALFSAAAPHQRTGEATATYIWSRTAADNIADLQPGARIIAILREPAYFLHSLHLSLLWWRIETEKDLRKAMALEASRREGRNIPRDSHLPQLLQYSDLIRYVEHLRRYHARFPRDQVLVLIYDDLRNDSETTIRRILRFLDVDDSYPLDLWKINVTKRTVRSLRLRGALRALTRAEGPISRSAKTAIRAVTTREMRRGAWRTVDRSIVSTAAPAPNAQLMVELRRRFLPEVVALSEYLDRDLVALWGYDELI